MKDGIEDPRGSEAARRRRRREDALALARMLDWAEREADALGYAEVARRLAEARRQLPRARPRPRPPRG